jgi:hypothetical protein
MAASSRIALSVRLASGRLTLSLCSLLPFPPTFPSIYRAHFVPGQRAAQRREQKASAVPPRLFLVAFGAAPDTIPMNGPGVQ